ncbi:MAG: translation initiation factor IF-2, partial [Lachnospiraceae bacterium]|nr:translation initiation factor IF-2 [Lachnospiraceae bacterium]
MSNIRVHELAKLLNKDSKEIIGVLKEHGVEVKSHMSSITDESVELVKKAFAPKEEKKIESKPENKPEKKQEKKQDKKSQNKEKKPDNRPEKKEEKNKQPKKDGNQEKNQNNKKNKQENKSHISQVYNPQNSSKNNKNNKNNQNNQNNKNNKNANKPAPAPAPVKEPVEEEIKVITIPESLTIGELANKMKIQSSVIVKKLFMQGQIVTINQEIDFEQAEEIAMEFDIIVEME